jgi:hypothetical protein
MKLEFTVHHACEQTGGSQYVLANSPFLSKINLTSNPPKKPFLGEGYYFWDYNIEQAERWGRSQVKGKYFVIEAVIKIDSSEDGFWLDLVGNRKHLVSFVTILNEFDLLDNENEHIKNIDLCEIINYLRTKCPLDSFPFRAIRAVDNSVNTKYHKRIAFNYSKRNFTLLDPKIIISFLNKKDIVYRNKQISKFAS